MKFKQPKIEIIEWSKEEEVIRCSPLNPNDPNGESRDIIDGLQ